MSAFRTLRVVAGVTAASAVAGAVAGMLAATGLLVVIEGPRALFGDVSLAPTGAEIGAICGAVLGPAAAFGFLRHVPLGQFFWQTIFATAVAGVVGFLLPVGFVPALVVAAGGFLSAAARLAWVHRAGPTATSLPPTN